MQLNRRLLAGGEGSRTDLLETQARHDLALAQEIEAADALDAALRELEVIIGEPMLLSDIAPLGSGFHVQPLQPQHFAAWRDFALAQNAELAGQRHALDAAGHQVEQARAGHFPSLSLIASSRVSSSDSENTYNQHYDTNSIGIQLSVPLFAGGGTSASRRQAASQYSQAAFELDAQTAMTLNELRRQYNLCISAQARVKAYELAVTSASALIEATKDSIAGGERVNLDVLDAEQQFHSARHDQAEARYGYLRAWLQLRYLAGKLGESDLHQLASYFGE